MTSYYYYRYNQHLFYLITLLIYLCTSLCKSDDDLLDQYVQHIQLVNSDINSSDNNNKFNTIRNKREISSDILWTHSMILDEDGLVTLSWQPRHQEILFRVEAKTLGYIGIGFSNFSSMEGADIVLGWMDDKLMKPFLLDCHGGSKSQGSAPIRDLTDNYTLMRGEQNDTHTIIEFRRVLDTCDSEDYVLTSDTVRILWAIHDSDPRYVGEMIYHEEKRGSQSVHLLGPPPTPSTMDKSNKEFTRNWDVVLNNFQVQNNMDTIYWCKVFKAPTFNEKHHIIGFEPIIGKRHKKMVHHMLMHECELGEGTNLAIWEKYAKQDGRLCYSNMLPDWEKCLTPIVAWAVGSKGESFPNHLGLPLGSKKNSFYMLEVHFDNPQMKSVQDTTGLRIQYTNKLREHEGGIFMVGVALSTLHFIPPFQREFKTAGYCSVGCTKETFPKDGVNVVSVLLHSHLAGRKLKLRHIRAGKELPPLAQDDRYDFNYQQSRTLSQDTTVLPGDGLITECTYSTENRIRPTLGGYSTRDEMCLSFVLYYPRIELSGCYSIPPVRYFFKSLLVDEFYGKNMSAVEQMILEGRVDNDPILTPPTITSTQKPFEIHPGDELSPEANYRAILALQNAKEYNIEGENVENSVFERLIIKEPREFQNKSFMQHVQNIPFNETTLAKNLENFFYNGLHMTFCRKKDDTLAVKETVENLPAFVNYEEKENIQCSYKAKKTYSSGSSKIINYLYLFNVFQLLYISLKFLI